MKDAQAQTEVSRILAEKTRAEAKAEVLTAQNHELASSIARLEESLKTASAQLEDIKEANEQLTSKDLMASEVAAAQAVERAEGLQRSLDAATTAREQAERRAMDAEQQMRDMEVELASLRERDESSTTELRVEVKAIKDELTQAVSRAAAAEASLVEVRSQLDLSKGDYERASTHARSLESELQQAENTVASLSATITELRVQVDSVGDTRAELATLAAQLSTAQSELATVSVAKEDLERQLKSMEHSLAEAHHEIALARQAAEHAKGAVMDAETSAVRDALSRVAEAERRAEVTDADMRGLRNQIETLEAAVRDAAHKLDVSERSNRALIEKAMQLEASLASEQSTASSLQARLESLRRAKEDAEVDHVAVVEGLNTEVMRLREKVTEKNATLAMEQLALQSLREQNAALLNASRAWSAEAAAASRLASRTEGELDKAHADLVKERAAQRLLTTPAMTKYAGRSGVVGTGAGPILGATPTVNVHIHHANGATTTKLNADADAATAATAGMRGGLRAAGGGASVLHDGDITINLDKAMIQSALDDMHNVSSSSSSSSSFAVPASRHNLAPPLSSSSASLSRAFETPSARGAVSRYPLPFTPAAPGMSALHVPASPIYSPSSSSSSSSSHANLHASSGLAPSPFRNGSLVLDAMTASSSSSSSIFNGGASLGDGNSSSSSSSSSSALPSATANLLDRVAIAQSRARVAMSSSYSDATASAIRAPNIEGLGTGAGAGAGMGMGEDVTENVTATTQRLFVPSGLGTSKAVRNAALSALSKPAAAASTTTTSTSGLNASLPPSNVSTAMKIGDLDDATRGPTASSTSTSTSVSFVGLGGLSGSATPNAAAGGAAGGAGVRPPATAGIRVTSFPVIGPENSTMSSETISAYSQALSQFGNGSVTAGDDAGMGGNGSGSGSLSTPPDIPGCKIVTVNPGTFAAEAGMLPNDIVLSVNGIRTARFEDFSVAKSALRENDVAPFVIRRNGNIHTIYVRIGVRGVPAPRTYASTRDPRNRVRPATGTERDALA